MRCSQMCSCGFRCEQMGLFGAPTERAGDFGHPSRVLRCARRAERFRSAPWAWRAERFRSASRLGWLVAGRTSPGSVDLERSRCGWVFEANSKFEGQYVFGSTA